MFQEICRWVVCKPMPKRRRAFVSGTLCLAAATLLGGCQSLTRPDQMLPRFEVIADGDAFPVNVPSSFESVRGWLVVAEDRNESASRTVRLPVAIVKSRNGGARSPVLYLSGGPGTSALRTAAYPGAYPWLEERDFVIFGQRGTEYASPALTCPELDVASSEGSDPLAAITACRQRLVADGVHLEHYHSVASAADIEDLRRVLGVERWNLYGVSYGTRLALTYAQAFPERLRAMLLDSPLPPNAIYDDESTANLSAALHAVADDCARRDECRQAFPDLSRRFFATLAQIERHAIINPATSEVATQGDLLSLIDLSSAVTIAQAPLVMDAIARLDARALAHVGANGVRASDLAWGMRLSVWCSEAFPFSQRSRMDAPPAIFGGLESAAVPPAWCDAWNVPPVTGQPIAPVSSDIPTLIVVGEFDPVTPPVWGALAAETLSKSRVISVRGEGHLPTQQWGGDGCAMQVAAAFLAAPDAVLGADEADFCVFSRGGPDYVTVAP